MRATPQSFVRVQKIGGNLLLVIPRALARELNVRHREPFYVFRGGPRRLIYTALARSRDGRLR